MRVDTIISRIINFGIFFCSVEGLQVGLLSPIEVVEEYGCHDTEIRLTCGNFDSKLAILEATFAPNCTHHECLQYDVRRLVQSVSIKETEESKNAERKAGQKFLETLQQAHLSDEEIDSDVVEDAFTGDENNNAEKNNSISLRVVLEKLIIRYLRQLSPEDELDENLSRHRRNILSEIHTHSDEIDSNENAESSEDNTRLQSTRINCEEQKRQVSSINILDLQRSYSNQSDFEYNIRNVLNKRCSGKNHCSFIFAIDHPFARIWKGGVVRIKYICMEDFRINRYCGEHLAINLEIDPNKQFDDTDGNGPIAQHRIQPRETFLHSLKIIKADEKIASNTMNISKIPEPRKITKSAVPIKQLGNDLGEQKRVYSQDFRVLKILPSNIDNFNDLETVGNEIYFRKEEEALTIENNSTEATILANYTLNNISNDLNRDANAKERKAEENSDISDSLENVTITIREGGHYFTVYQNVSKTLKSTPSNIAVDRGKYSIEENILQYSTTPSTNIALTTDDDGISITEISSTTVNNFRSTDNVNLETMKTQDLHTFHDNDIYKLKKLGERERIVSSYRQPLLHGFAMTPGYPKFYIGEFECYWSIIAPENIRVRISILDISLRYDSICKDYLQIDDVGSRKMLFNSCADAIYPIGIVSSSNWIKVTIKTTSKFAYPKRGILLHYTADGCVNLPIPANVKLVDRTATTAFYECLPSFLFPDSRHSTRKLTCSNIHVWDKLLPNCIEQEKIFRRAVLLEDRLALINKKPDLSQAKNKMPSQKDADMIFEVNHWGAGKWNWPNYEKIYELYHNWEKEDGSIYVQTQSGCINM